MGGFNDSKHILHRPPRSIGRDPRVPENRPEVERTGQHVEHQLDVALSARFATFLRAFERLAHRSATRCEHFLSNDGGQLRILRHVCGQAGKRLTQWASECSKQRADGSFQITANTAGIGRGVVTHFTHDRVGHEMPLTWPAPIHATAGTTYLPRNTIDRDRPVSAVLQRAQYRSDDLGVDTLIARTSEALRGRRSGGLIGPGRWPRMPTRIHGAVADRAARRVSPAAHLATRVAVPDRGELINLSVFRDIV